MTAATLQGRSAVRDARRPAPISRERQVGQPARAIRSDALSILLFAAGISLFGLSMGSSLIELPPQLFTSAAIVLFLFALRAAGVSATDSCGSWDYRVR